MSRNRATNLLTDTYAILRRPILTEKSHDLIAAGTKGKENADVSKSQYTFEVHIKSNRHQIKKAIEAAFGVKVESVNTMIVKPRRKASRGKAAKAGFSRQRKKAIVRLTKDSKQIELM
ncbi:MAG: 50S ribosomal protein L23 [Planctomycetota bacterium]